MNESWVTLIMLGIAAGFMPMVFGLEIYTKSSQSADSASSSSANSKALSVGVMGMIGLGLMLAVTNVNQWLFVSTAVNQILRMEAQPWTQLLAFILFMGVAHSDDRAVAAHLSHSTAAGASHIGQSERLDQWLHALRGCGPPLPDGSLLHLARR